MYEMVGTGVDWRVGGAVGEGLGDGEGEGDSVGGAVVTATVAVAVGVGDATVTVGAASRNATARSSIPSETTAIASCRVVKRRIVLG
jgi:hypothetical protein